MLKLKYTTARLAPMILPMPAGVNPDTDTDTDSDHDPP